MKIIENMKYGEKYNLRIGDQLVVGVFVREIKQWGLFTRYEFSVNIHTRDLDYDREYESVRVYKVKKEDIISKA